MLEKLDTMVIGQLDLEAVFQLSYEWSAVDLSAADITHNVFVAPFVRFCKIQNIMVSKVAYFAHCVIEHFQATHLALNLHSAY